MAYDLVLFIFWCNNIMMYTMSALVFATFTVSGFRDCIFYHYLRYSVAAVALSMILFVLLRII